MSTSRRRRLALNTRYPTPPGVADLHSAGAEATGGWETDKADERWVSTHCAFCGIQCGMHLRVAAGEVVGVEPRMDTHNKGKLCPKGAAAYQQLSHPERLPHPLARAGGVSRRTRLDRKSVGQGTWVPVREDHSGGSKIK